MTALGLRPVALCLLAVGLVAGCAPGAPASTGGGANLAETTKAAPKRIKAATIGIPHTFYNKLNLGGGIQGIDAIQDLLHTNLARPDANQNLHPGIAEAVPSLANGQWKLFPDGKMETAWKLRSDVRWHDGTPFTAEDVAFSGRIARDRELPQFRNLTINNFVDSIEAPDSQTVVVKWREPYFAADQPFDAPLPAHILREALANKADFLNLSYWREEFVGTGAYRVREFDPGAHLILEAFDGYFLGRSKIDTIEIRFIPDPNTLVANILAGEVELTLGRALSPDQAQEVREHWQRGQVEPAPSYLHRMIAQTQNPTPAVIADPRFRQALFYAMDRQEIVDTIFYGMTAVARTWLVPNQPQYREIEASVAQYSYDPRRAAQLIESLGYVKAADGSYATPAGPKLNGVEVRAAGGGRKIQVAVADQWQRAGVGVDIVVVTPQQNQDREYRAKRPGFVLTGGGAFDNFQSSEIPTAENSYLGVNQANWSNSKYDDFLSRYQRTIPRPEQIQILGELLRVLGDELPAYPMFHEVDLTTIGRRINGVSPYMSGVPAWNNHLWDITS